MKTVKRILVVTLVVLCVAMVAAIGAFLLVDDATLVSFLVKRVESTTGARIDYADGASISRTTHPTLTLDELVMVDNEDQYRIETHSLLLQILARSLINCRFHNPPLFSGS